MATDISKYFNDKGLNGGGASGDIPVVGFPNFPVATRIPEEALEYAIDQAEMEAEKSQVEDAIGKMIVDNMDLATIEFINHLNSNLGSDMYESKRKYSNTGYTPRKI